MSDPDLVQTELKNGVLKITLNRPKANAFNFEMIEAAQKAFREAEREAQVRCVLLTGAGHVFSAGQDVTVFEQIKPGDIRFHLQRTYNLLILQIRRLEKPVLAVVNGTAAGAALGIALACDLRLAAEEARFVVGFLGIGLAPDSGVSLFLPAIIGLGRATEFTYTNEPISASQALAWGLVNRVVPAAQLEEVAYTWAEVLGPGSLASDGPGKTRFQQSDLPSFGRGPGL